MNERSDDQTLLLRRMNQSLSFDKISKTDTTLDTTVSRNAFSVFLKILRNRGIVVPF